MILKIQDNEFPVVQIYTVVSDAEWDYRYAYFIKMQIDYATVKSLFVNDAVWSTIENEEEIDRSDYCVAGKIIDYRNGQIGVYMGRKTEEEKAEDEAARILPIIQKALPSLSDEDALAVATYFPKWEVGVELAVNDRVFFEDALWKVTTAHTTQESWEPTVASTLYVRVSLESEEGSIDNPIAYGPGMELIQDKYYKENGVVYLCNRSSGVPLYNALADLINLYVVTVG